MKAHAIHRFARISPLKARDVAREVQGLSVSEALDILNFTPRKAARIIHKTLRSAVANAENKQEDVDVESLVVESARVDTGPAFKRFKPRARGSAAPIKRRTSHILLVVSDEVVPLSNRRVRGVHVSGDKTTSNDSEESGRNPVQEHQS